MKAYVPLPVEKKQHPDLQDNGQVPSRQSLQRCTSNMPVRRTTAQEGASKLIVDHANRVLDVPCMYRNTHFIQRKRQWSGRLN